jgi:hypothetical protein
MAGPGNGIADADRERVIETLKVAFVQERLTMEELDARIGGALGARSGAELAVLTADLPGGLAAPPPPTREARLSKEVRDGLRVIGSLYLIAAILWLSAVLAGYDTVGAAVSFTAVMTTMVALFSSLHGAAVLVHARRRARSGRPLPPGELRSRPASCAGPWPPLPGQDDGFLDVLAGRGLPRAAALAGPGWTGRAVMACGWR